MSNELLDPRLPPLVRIVDDDDRVRQSEAFVLRLEGFDVREYSSAEDFLHFDDVSRAGCIVLDIRMPGMNGLELQSELLRTGRSLPILFLTGHGDVAMAVDALKRGAADFIQKPVKAERLAALTDTGPEWTRQTHRASWWWRCRGHTNQGCPCSRWSPPRPRELKANYRFAAFAQPLPSRPGYP